MFWFDASRTHRIAFATIVTAAIIAAPIDAAAAKHRKHVVRHHRTHASVQMAQAAAPQPATLGPVRYYGGPKSPMWREVR
jgi:hypothetical protein